MLGPLQDLYLNASGPRPMPGIRSSIYLYNIQIYTYIGGYTSIYHRSFAVYCFRSNNIRHSYGYSSWRMARIVTHLYNIMCATLLLYTLHSHIGKLNIILYRRDHTIQ